MGRKMFWFAAYVLTGIGMMASAIINGESMLNLAILLPVAVCYVLALSVHFKELKG